MKLTGKLNTLGISTMLCNWILDIVTKRPQSVVAQIQLLPTTPGCRVVVFSELWKEVDIKDLKTAIKETSL